MKKIAFLLALMTVTSLCLASCNNESGDNSTTTTTAATTTTATTTTTKTPPPFINPDKTEEETKAPDLADGSKFVLDGDLSEWADLHKIELVGEKANDDANYSHKKATFYGVMTDLGMYLACDAYHDVYIGSSGGEWWTNSNYEFFIGLGNAQKYVYAKGLDLDCATSGDDVTAKMVTVELTDGPTNYHTITEVFIPMDYLSESDIMYNTIDVGVAWKTLGDLIIGGGANVGPNGEDEYWVPKGTWPNGTNKTIVAPSGIYLPGEYEF